MTTTESLRATEVPPVPTTWNAFISYSHAVGEPIVDATSPITLIAAVANSPYVIVAGESGHYRYLDPIRHIDYGGEFLHSGSALVADLMDAQGDVAGLAFTDGGKQILTVDQTSGAKLIDVSSGVAVGRFSDEDAPPLRSFSIVDSDAVFVTSQVGTDLVTI